MPKFTDCRNCKHLLFSFVDTEGKMISCIQDIKEYYCGNEDSENYNYQIELHNCCKGFERFEK